jgi:hypothetical protein
MAVYRIYPNKDATLYSESPYSNTGADEILEIASYTDSTGVVRASRAILSFDINELKTVINSKVTGDYESYLKLFIAEASEIPVEFTIEGYPVGQNWEEGTGKYGDTPINTTGVSWWTTEGNTNSIWNTDGVIPSITSYINTGYVSSGYVLSEDVNVPITGSFPTTQPGGGSWYYENTGSDLLRTTQEFLRREELDLNIDISSYIERVFNNDITGNGILLKLENDIEFSEDYNIRLRYFSFDTNTIYLPCIELKWNDTTYNTGSLQVLNTSNFTLSLKNNKDRYKVDETVKFRLSCRPKNPTRTFLTSSIYLQNFALPQNCSWSIVDEFTKEKVIDFSEEHTLIGCDENGPYFTFYMNTLSPERYYTLQIKTLIDGSTQINEIGTFKVVKNE